MYHPKHWIKQHRISQLCRKEFWVSLAGFSAQKLTKLKSRCQTVELTSGGPGKDPLPSLFRLLANSVPCDFKPEVPVSLLGVSQNTVFPAAAYIFLLLSPRLFPRRKDWVPQNLFKLPFLHGYWPNVCVPSVFMGWIPTPSVMISWGGDFGMWLG
jgi:hypothetical protein